MEIEIRMYIETWSRKHQSSLLTTLSTHNLHSLIKCSFFQSNGRLGYCSKRCTFSITKSIIFSFGLYEGRYILVAD